MAGKKKQTNLTLCSTSISSKSGSSNSSYSAQEKAESDEERFAYLVKTRPTSYKRIVVGVYKEYEAEEKQGDQERKVKRSLFDEAVMLLKASVAQRGKKDETDLMLLQENIKSKLKNLKIRNFKFDLEKYHARFVKTVRLLKTIGVDMDENYLLRIFANGCIEHRDLRTRSFTNYHELKIEYSNLLETKELKQSGKAEKGFQEAASFIQQDVPSVTRKFILRIRAGRNIRISTLHRRRLVAQKLKRKLHLRSRNQLSNMKLRD